MSATDKLTYYPDSRPGIRRQKRGRGFSYIAPDGSRIDDKEELARLRALAVPPAYVDVWICPRPNGHLQATGYDARGRKQYRYHPRWTARQAGTKFAALVAFGEALPRIRRRVRRDLGEDAGERAFALAAAVALIDRLSLRVGSPVYARENHTFGALTLKRRHLRLRNGKLHVAFKAKGGKRVRRQLGNRSLMQALERIRDLPGADLLAWLDEDGTPRALTSSALNDYIAEAGQADAFTAKTFRTWAGTVAAFTVALDKPEPKIGEMAEAAAERLHNSPAIARSSYIHPAVLDLCRAPVKLPKAAPKDGLTLAERRLLAYLRRA